ncbi:ATP-dependent RNA helicase dbp8 [Penicillium pulvis]|uniref:ATP-dependent RNA helicase dbp8 n=1 Tax=Penicillium pulvis TaxID=1562058 RepID=UPI002548DBCE|nr:ATP-dependent RNA helicase dbp8 [Penicillium pulvis]KAJ5793034.1 ATP-dependent RNA helicase dbp8 [Penicillium pulvis]
MASSQDDLKSDDSYASDSSEDNQIDAQDRASKRRRLSESSTDSYVAPAPLPTLSRIKKKDDTKKPELNDDENPVTIKDALEIGLQAEQSTFGALDVSPWLVGSLTTMAVRRPTAIQKACIPEILKGRDCIGGSRTGSGKTIAFAVPIMQKWAKDPFGIFALVLTPTRELALQIFEQFKAISAPQSMKPILITGGTDMRQQAIALAERPHVVIATPGRLADHIKTSGQDTIAGLGRVKMVVMDEADRLLTGGQGSMLPDVETCLSALPPSAERQTLLFTATLTAEVRALQSMPRPEGKPPIFVTEIGTENEGKIPPNPETDISQKNISKPVIIFCNHTKTTDLLERTLRRLGHRATSLHSLLPQSERTSNLARFRAAAARVLVATDVASRGLDIPIVSLVINFDVPRNPDDYVHRVGRTARAGRAGEAVTLVGQRDVELILAIEARVGRQMEEWAQEGVNIESRVVRTNVLKEVGSAKREAMGEIDEGRDVLGRKRNKLKKVR